VRLDDGGLDAALGEVVGERGAVQAGTGDHDVRARLQRRAAGHHGEQAKKGESHQRRAITAPFRSADFQTRKVIAANKLSFVMMLRAVRQSLHMPRAHRVLSGKSFTIDTPYISESVPLADGVLGVIEELRVGARAPGAASGRRALIPGRDRRRPPADARRAPKRARRSPHALVLHLRSARRLAARSHDPPRPPCPACACARVRACVRACARVAPGDRVVEGTVVAVVDTHKVRRSTRRAAALLTGVRAPPLALRC
jgi:hypothetical protein